VLRARVHVALCYPEVRRFALFPVVGGLSAMVTITMTSIWSDLEHQRFLWSALAGYVTIADGICLA
jgi:hypothetical protein